MNILDIILSCIVSVVVGKCLYYLLFDGWDDFKECARFALTPDIVSIITREWSNDEGLSFRFKFFFWLSVGAGTLVYFGLTALFEKM